MAMIMVLEDMDDTRNLVALVMQAMGHETRTAATGHEALKLAMSMEFDAYLLDIGLPDMSGFEVARFIRHLHGEKPRVLALTGYAGRTMRVQCLNAGFDYYVLKPCDCVKIEQLLTH